MKKFSLLLMVSFIVLCSCTNDTSSNSSSSVDSSTQQSNQQNSNYTTNEYKIESSGSFEIDYVSYQYPTLKKTVNNATTSVALNNEIVVSSGCKWTLSKDIEGTNLIKTKNMSLTEGHNYAYITVWDASEEHNAIYYVDVYRLSMFTYQFYDGDKLIKSDVIEENQFIDLPNSEVEKTGYSFECWVDENGTEVTFPYIIKSDINFYTKWNVNQYTINFNLDGGNTISSLTYDYGTSIMLPIPEKKGYQFVGWVNDDIILENNLVVSKNLDLIAYWIDDNLNYVINDDYKTITLLSVKNINKNSTYFIPSYVSVIKSRLFENDSSLAIYCEATSRPSGWESYWNYSGCPVYYGITKDTKIEKDGIIYVIQNNEAIVTRYVGNDTNVTVPNTIELNGKTYKVTTIGYRAFYNCTSLTNITIPNSVKTIENSSFHNCLSLTSITIPSSVTTIGNSAFYSCDSLLTIYCETSSQPSGWSSNWNYGRPVYYGVTKDTKIEKDGIIYVIQNDEAIVTRYVGNDTRVTVSSTIELNGKAYKVIAIGSYAFYNCTSLTNVVLPNSVITIGKKAFLECTSLENITLPDSVITIEDRAFRGCSSLENITIPNSTKTIGEYIFDGCTSLEKITLPFIGESKNKNTYLGYMFGAVSYRNNSNVVPSSLKEVVIIKGCTSISNYAFYNCTSLISITIPSSVTTIGMAAFEGCSSLEKITLPFVGESKDNNTYLGYVFGASSSNSDDSKDVPSSLKEVVILEGCTSLGYEAFRGCTSLMSITLPNSLTTIGYGAFYYCKSLISITIPSSVTTIGGYAFYNCASLKKITLPNRVETIKYSTFIGCSSLTIFCETSSQPSGWETNWNRGCPVYYGITKDNKIEKDGIIYIIQNDEAIVAKYVGNDTNVIIPNAIELNSKAYNVTSIGKEAFSGCSSLTKITLSSSVITIGEYAFSYCKSLTSIILPNSVTTIGERVFQGCSSLTNITLPSSVTIVGGYAFGGCVSLTNVYYGGTIENWHNIAFADEYANPTYYAKNFYVNVLGTYTNGTDTMILDDNGKITFNGTEGTYVISGTKVSVTIGGVTTDYTINVQEKTFTVYVLATNPFYVGTFTGSLEEGSTGRSYDCTLIIKADKTGTYTYNGTTYTFSFTDADIKNGTEISFTDNKNRDVTLTIEEVNNLIAIYFETPNGLNYFEGDLKKTL